MNRRLFWKLCFTIGTGVVALFYVINIAVQYLESTLSEISPTDKQTLIKWSEEAQELFLYGDKRELEQWFIELQQKENTWATIAKAEVTHLAGNANRFDDYSGYNMGRSVDWKIHLYFDYNPIMELPFSDGVTSLLVQLPDRMRPGSYWSIARILLQVFLPLVVLILVSVVLYRHIMQPLKELEIATKAFSEGRFDVRAQEQLGKRNDELTSLSVTFDRMADHIGDLIIRQRQLITDLSHELRTPLARLDIATENLFVSEGNASTAILDVKLKRIHRESKHIRQLVDDTLTLSWLENEAPCLRTESLDLVDLIDVLIEDARFEYADRVIISNLLDTAHIENSNHRALGQAIENVLRNALRYTPVNKSVTVELRKIDTQYEIRILDQGPGVPDVYLKSIFRPFFRVDTARVNDNNSFGLGLALAKRQIKAVNGAIYAENLDAGGLLMSIKIPCC